MSAVMDTLRQKHAELLSHDATEAEIKEFSQELYEAGSKTADLEEREELRTMRKYWIGQLGEPVREHGIKSPDWKVIDVDGEIVTERIAFKSDTSTNAPASSEMIGWGVLDRYRNVTSCLFILSTALLLFILLILIGNNFLLLIETPVDRPLQSDIVIVGPETGTTVSAAGFEVTGYITPATASKLMISAKETNGSLVDQTIVSTDVAGNYRASLQSAYEFPAPTKVLITVSILDERGDVETERSISVFLSSRIFPVIPTPTTPIVAQVSISDPGDGVLVGTTFRVSGTATAPLPGDAVLLQLVTTPGFEVLSNQYISVLGADPGQVGYFEIDVSYTPPTAATQASLTVTYLQGPSSMALIQAVRYIYLTSAPPE